MLRLQFAAPKLLIGGDFSFLNRAGFLLPSFLRPPALFMAIPGPWANMALPLGLGLWGATGRWKERKEMGVCTQGTGKRGRALEPLMFSLRAQIFKISESLQQFDTDPVQNYYLVYQSEQLHTGGQSSKMSQKEVKKKHLPN